MDTMIHHNGSKVRYFHSLDSEFEFARCCVIFKVAMKVNGGLRVLEL